MNREELLEQAEHIVTGERNKEYGSPEDSFRNISQLWSTYLGVTVTPRDVTLMMVLLKVARLRKTPGHCDSWVDIAGYAACGAELEGGGDGPCA